MGASDRCPVGLWLFLGLILAVALALLLGCQSDDPPIPIDHISTDDHLESARVVGRVNSGPEYPSHNGVLAFQIEDAAGVLRVELEAQLVVSLLAEGTVPLLGDQVTAEGLLLVGDGQPTLALTQSDTLLVERGESRRQTLAELAEDQPIGLVQVMGVVRQIIYPAADRIILELRDTTGVAHIIIEGDLIRLTGDIDPAVLSVGASIQVDGLVVPSTGIVSLLLADTARALPLDVMVDLGPLLTVAEIDSNSVGQFIQVLGVATAVVPVDGELRVILDDGTGVISILLGSDLAASLSPDARPQPGELLSAVGELAVHQGELVLQPQYPHDFRVVGPAPGGPLAQQVPTEPAPLPDPTSTAGIPTALSPTNTPPLSPTLVSPDHAGVRLGDIGLADLGRRISSRATVIEAISFSAGFKFLLDDGSGQITLLMWNEEYGGFTNRASLRPGSELQVTGQVSIYEGELQLEPAPGSLLITRPGTGPLSEDVPTGSLWSYLGKTVAVEGSIVGLEDFSGHGRLWVDDGSGPAQVILWHNVLMLVPVECLEAGARVRVIGSVSEYRSQVELVPALPIYVTPSAGADD